MESYTLMKIIVADDLPASALDLLRRDSWQIDARSGRSPEELRTDVADADAIVVRSATKVTREVIAATTSTSPPPQNAGS
jgi:D-3-phosphoglycerate dehydrogenase